MARINIDDKLFADPRFKALCRLVGSEETALGRMVLVFRMGQEYFTDGEKLIPHEIWDIQGFDHVEKVGFVERHEAGIYVKGSEDHFDWLIKKRSAAKAGGIKSAEKRRMKYGSAQPSKLINKESSPEALLEAPPKHSFENPEAPPNPLALALTLNTYTSNCAEIDQSNKQSNMADAIVAVWNQTLTDVLPKITKLTDKRRKLINAQLKKYPDIEYWKNIFGLVKSSDFLTGKTGAWKCGFDWILNENNRTKVEEGNYANKNAGTQKSAWHNSGYGAL